MMTDERSCNKRERLEMDRNARAYGWEVGKHGVLSEVIQHVCPDNPFLDPKWRNHVVPTRTGIQTYPCCEHCVPEADGRCWADGVGHGYHCTQCQTPGKEAGRRG